jgi:iron(III) transport system substrate-binding protein
MNRRHFFALAVVAATGLAATSAFAQQLPEKFANDPVAKAIGPAIFNAALKEGKLVWYGGTTAEDFLKKGGQKRFEERFGIKVEPVIGSNDAAAARVVTEAAVGKVSVDVFDSTIPHLFNLSQSDALQKWRPPAPELAKMMPDIFVKDPPDTIWPTHISAQALVVNTNLVKPEDEPKSYWDMVDPKWKGKIAMRDPRSASGGAWMMMGFAQQPGLGMEYIKKLKDTVQPFTIAGGSGLLRDAIVNGQFAIGLGGRGEFIADLPKGAPIKYVVPKEGMAWTPAGIGILAKGPNPNAAKVALTWYYELAQLQLWTEVARPIPHPDVKVSIPEMSVSAYPLMKQLPMNMMAAPDDFLIEMEKVFGNR